jgi:hypothetical protein
VVWLLSAASAFLTLPVVRPFRIAVPRWPPPLHLGFRLAAGGALPAARRACPVSHREFGTVGAVAAEAADADGQVLGSRMHRIGGFSLTISSPTGWGRAVRKSTCMIELRAEEMRTSLPG